MKHSIGHLCLVAATVAGSLLSTTGEAEAASAVKTCTVTGVEYDGRLMIDCSGDSNRYYGYASSSTSCVVAGADKVKVWESMLLSAMIAGKTVNLTYETAPATASCGRALYSVLVLP